MTRSQAPVGAASKLVLLLVSLLAVGGAMAQTPLDSAKQQCDLTGRPTALSPDTRLSNASCVACVEKTYNNNEGFWWACIQYCQADQYVNPSTYGSETAGTDCSGCLSNVDNPYGCQVCMTAQVVQDPKTVGLFPNRSYCFNCVETDPYNGKNDSFIFACGECSALFNSEAQTQCDTCIHDPSPSVDFGACVYQAQLKQAILEDLPLPSGVTAQCFTPTAPGAALAITPQQCVDCMRATLTTDATVNKTYGCHAYCQDPLLVTDSDEAAQCLICMQLPEPVDPFACQNCMQSSTDFNSRQECFNCVQNDPYNGMLPNYNWGCGQCSSITNVTLMADCITCIQTAGTQATICDCVDLIKNDQIATQVVLDAFERSCYAPWTITSAATGKPENLTINFSGEGCLNCMRLTEDALSATDHYDKRYACRQYCQDPTLVANETEGDDCATCVENIYLDAWGCQSCMTMAAPGNRPECFDCVLRPTAAEPSTFPNYAWGCGQCAAMTNSTARDLCYTGLCAGLLDPCLVVAGNPFPEPPMSMFINITVNNVCDSCIMVKLAAQIINSTCGMPYAVSRSYPDATSVVISFQMSNETTTQTCIDSVVTKLTNSAIYPVDSSLKTCCSMVITVNGISSNFSTASCNNQPIPPGGIQNPDDGDTGTATCEVWQATLNDDKLTPSNYTGVPSVIQSGQPSAADATCSGAHAVAKPTCYYPTASYCYPINGSFHLCTNANGFDTVPGPCPGARCPDTPSATASQVYEDDVASNNITCNTGVTCAADCHYGSCCAADGKCANGRVNCGGSNRISCLGGTKATQYTYGGVNCNLADYIHQAATILSEPSVAPVYNIICDTSFYGDGSGRLGRINCDTADGTCPPNIGQRYQGLDCVFTDDSKTAFDVCACEKSVVLSAILPAGGSLSEEDANTIASSFNLMLNGSTAAVTPFEGVGSNRTYIWVAPDTKSSDINYIAEGIRQFFTDLVEPLTAIKANCGTVFTMYGYSNLQDSASAVYIDTAGTQHAWMNLTNSPTVFLCPAQNTGGWTDWTVVPVSALCCNTVQ